MSLAERVEQCLGARTSQAYGQVTVDVVRDDWVSSVRSARDQLALTYFDHLTVVDEQAAGFDVVLRLWSPMTDEALQLRTRCPREEAAVPSLTQLFAGAAWHERQAAELFGISFVGHPHPAPLLLPEGFDGHPLRKDFLLAARLETPWPGAKDPGESDRDLADAPVRRKSLPFGVPPPGASS